jgi:hypothetical protein
MVCSKQAIDTTGSKNGVLGYAFRVHRLLREAIYPRENLSTSGPLGRLNVPLPRQQTKNGLAQWDAGSGDRVGNGCEDKKGKAGRSVRELT